jgi:hypothetical protein
VVFNGEDSAAPVNRSSLLMNLQAFSQIADVNEYTPELVNYS